MTEQRRDLKPTEKSRLIDLVEEAGLDVSDWGRSSRGAKGAAANPKYCYEWSFVEPGKVVLVNLWHRHLKERADGITWSQNVRRWFRDPSLREAKSVWRRRATKFDLALQEATRHKLHIRAIINDGTMRDSEDPKAKASSVQHRLLDPLPWSVTAYDWKTGQCTLTRGGTVGGSVDQFDLSQEGASTPSRKDVVSSVFERDSALRAAALRRANGFCEFCLRPGFSMSDGRVFLETHHVVPLSEGGTDSAGNIVAICPNHHREAHHGARASTIRRVLLERLRARTRRRSA